MSILCELAAMKVTCKIFSDAGLDFFCEAKSKRFVLPTQTFQPSNMAYKYIQIVLFHAIRHKL